MNKTVWKLMIGLAALGGATTLYADDGADAAPPAAALQLPAGLPASFSLSVPYSGEQFTLRMEKNSVFGKHTRFLVAGPEGVLREIPAGPDRTYLGRVAGHPGYSVSAVLTESGLLASIIRPGMQTIKIEPLKGRQHRISLESANDAQAAPQPADTSRLNQQGLAASTSAVTTVFQPLETVAATTSSTATLPPSRVMDVLEYEIGVEIGSKAFLDAGAYNGNLAYAQSVAQGMMGNLDARFLRAAGIKHRLGTVIIRADAATDPLRNTVTTINNSSLSAFRDYWNGHPAEVGTTHDLAVYHVFSSPSGLAWVNSVGSANRYALSCGHGATSWADGTISHEFGHSWSLPHTTNQEEVYESKPRNNAGTHSAGGTEVFVSIMHGGGSHNIGRLASYEANKVYNTRQNKRGYGDLVASPGPIAPFGYEDRVSIFSLNPITIDVIANDYDCNNDVLDVELLDTVSQMGATISLSAGTGPGGRNEIIYTPPASPVGSRDFFHYTVVDSTGRTDWGCVYVSYAGIIVIDPATTSFNYDLGSGSSPVMANWRMLTPDASGDVSWSGAPISAADRGAKAGVNDINRDLVYGSGVSQLNHKIGNGVWAITINMGDAGYAHDLMGVRAEGVELHNNISNTPGTFPYANGQITVTDGELNLEFFDAGGADPNWVVTRLSLTKIGDLVTVDTAATAYNYDLGPAGSPVMTGWTAITPDIAGDIHWTGGWIKGYDRNPGGSVNDINRDLIRGTATATLNHKIANGIWKVTMNMGDADAAHDRMRVMAEGTTTIASNINSTAGSYPYAIGEVTVTDGELNLLFLDDGGTSSDWAITRLSLTKLADMTVVDTNATSFSYDLGPSGSPVMEGWTALTPDVQGDISWSGGPFGAFDRNPGGGVNAINQDLVRGIGPTTLNHKIGNGVWDITLNMGDADAAHDLMGVRAEGVTIASNINSAAGSYPYAYGRAIVTDGELNLEFFDAGGADPYWVVTRLSLTLNQALANDYDDDGLPNNWENQYFGNALSAGPMDDPDGDLLKNLAEYAFGGNPGSAAQNGTLPRLERDGSGGMRYVYSLRDDPNLQATILVCTNLASNVWNPLTVQTGATGTGISAYTNSLPAEDHLYIKWKVAR